jgi:hypothetical protein
MEALNFSRSQFLQEPHGITSSKTTTFFRMVRGYLRNLLPPPPPAAFLLLVDVVGPPHVAVVLIAEVGHMYLETFPSFGSSGDVPLNLHKENVYRTTCDAEGDRQVHGRDQKVSRLVRYFYRQVSIARNDVHEVTACRFNHPTKELAKILTTWRMGSSSCSLKLTAHRHSRDATLLSLSSTIY